jgi:hypothetical protein
MVRSREQRAASVAGAVALVLRSYRWTVLILLAVVVLLFAFGRMIGAVREPLEGGTFVVVLVSATLLTWWVRWPAISRLRGEATVTRLPPWPGMTADVARWWHDNEAKLIRVLQATLGGTLVMMLTAVVLSATGVSSLAMLVGWLLVVGSEALLVAIACGAGRTLLEVTRIMGDPVSRTESANQSAPGAFLADRELGNRQGADLGRREPLRVSLGEDGEDVEEFEDEEEEVLPAGIVQQITRSRLPDGGDAIEGLLRCTFDSRETMQVVHVAFCPPLSNKPEFEVNQLSGPEADIRATQVEVFGARLEVRLEETCEEPVDIVLRIYAVG